MDLPELKPGEIYVESARVFKDCRYFCIGIGKVINKKGYDEMVAALKKQLNADRVYLMTTESKFV
jgi:hypothetical protein